MKKSFVYLIVALMLAGILCGCGMDTDKGVIGASPKPTDTINASPTIRPDVSPTIIPDNVYGDDYTVSGSQVGPTGTAKPSPKVTEDVKR